MAAVTAAHEAEAQRVDLLFYWAVSQLGDATILDALDLWKQVPAAQAAQGASWWLAAVLKLVQGHRSKAADLAIAYYRLVRALRTGRTMRDPQVDKAGTVSLERLRLQFETAVDQADPAIPTGSSTRAERDRLLDQLHEAETPGDISIPLDAGVDPDDLAGQLDDEAKHEGAEVLDQLGIENLLGKLEKLDEDAPTAEVHDLAGKRQAAAAARISMNAARGLAYSLAEHDGRAIGWVRYSTTGHPCGFCAMLISRSLVTKAGEIHGAGVLYRSSKGGSKNAAGEWVADQDRYHDNCRCVSVPIFSLSQLEGALFDQTRFYADLWMREIQGKYSGDQALTVWRRLIRDLAKSTTPSTAVQATA